MMVMYWNWLWVSGMFIIVVGNVNIIAGLVCVVIVITMDIITLKTETNTTTLIKSESGLIPVIMLHYLMKL